MSDQLNKQFVAMITGNNLDMTTAAVKKLTLTLQAPSLASQILPAGDVVARIETMSAGNGNSDGDGYGDGFGNLANAWKYKMGDGFGGSYSESVYIMHGAGYSFPNTQDQPHTHCALLSWTKL